MSGKVSEGAISVEGVMRDLSDYVRRETGQEPPPDAHLLDSGILDSMAMVLFVSYVEQRFDIDMDVDALARGVLATVRSAAEHVTATLSASDHPIGG